MVCSKCNNVVSENDKFCSNCGNFLSNVQPQLESVQPQVSNIEQPVQTIEQNVVDNNIAQNDFEVEPDIVQNIEPVITEQPVEINPVQGVPVQQPVEQTPVINPTPQIPINNYQPILNSDSELTVNTQPPINNVQPVQQPQTIAPVQPVQQSVQQTPIINPIQQFDINPNSNNNPKKKKKTFLVIFIIIAVLASLFALTMLWEGRDSRDKKDKSSNELVVNPPAAANRGTRTIMIYMIGADLESKSHAATSDIKEIMQSDYNTEDVNVVIYTGGSKTWYTPEISSNENAIYEVTKDGLNKVKTYSKKQTTKPDSLTEFIDYVYDNYKSDLYDLVLWDHGGGPIFGYGVDEFYQNDPLDMNELNYALDNSKLIKDTKFEAIIFDACLMGSVEIANTLKEEANYLIASEESVPGNGLDYTFLKDVSKSTTSEEMGRKIIDSFYLFYDSNTYSYGYYMNFKLQLSLIDLSKIDDIILELDQSFIDYADNLSTTSFNSISRDANKATIYGYTTDEDSYDLVDFYGLVDEIISGNNKSSLQSAIKDSIVYQKTNIRGSNGLSIYFPQKNKKYASKLIRMYGNLEFSDNYQKFLENYEKILNGGRLVDANITKNITPTINTQTNVLRTEIPTELQDNYLNADYIIFKSNEDGGYYPVYKAKDVIINGNELTTTPKNKELVITDKNGNDAGFVLSREYERDENSVTYIATIELENIDEEDFINNFRLDIALAFVKFENGSNEGQVIDIKYLNSDKDQLQGKETVDLANYTHIISMSSSYTIEDENGNPLDDFINGDTIKGMEYNIKKDGFKFVLKDLDSSAEYYYVFRVTDSQGNIHCMKKLKIE